MRECGMWNAECGIRSAKWGMRSAKCGMRNAECGMRNEEVGISDFLNIRRLHCDGSIKKEKPGFL
jgi:hypothetical protein